MQPRAYLELFYTLVEQVDVRRAIVLMGPRRVGKTILIHRAIQKLLAAGHDPRGIAYVSRDHPIYNGLGLEELVEAVHEASGLRERDLQRFVFFDEIQYLRNREVHLKTLVDSSPGLKVTASGSAAAALRLKSTESGAGRFTDFPLPPLTFHEFLRLSPEPVGVRLRRGPEGDPVELVSPDIEVLNREFLRYLNVGGYPEALHSAAIQADPGRFIRSDIIDKVLLRDLPSLYGIQDIQELNSLFTRLAFNTAQEVSIEQLTRKSGVSKNTLKKHIEYLEAAFLLKVVHRVDVRGRRFQRANCFKVYLTNPSIWSALFAPLDEADESLGSLVETAVLAQWFHAPAPLRYARWGRGEVGVVGLDPRQRIAFAAEVTWSDRFVERPEELVGPVQFARSNDLDRIRVTTRSRFGAANVRGIEVRFTPASVYCYGIGAEAVEVKRLSAPRNPRLGPARRGRSGPR
jgi:predicted AAA+ superfamily ATPase